MVRNSSRVGTTVVVALLAIAVPLVALAERKVAGKITDKNGNPADGLRVEAWDADTGADDKMKGPVTTDDSGNYELQYRKGRWDPDTWGTTWWRPDIYIRVKAPGGHCEDSNWKDSDWHEIARSSKSEDHRVSQDLTKNLTLSSYPSDTIHGEATIGENMFCETSFLHANCFACIGEYKIVWTDWSIEGLPTFAHPCGSPSELSKCTKSDRSMIEQLATDLGDPGYYD